MLRRWREQSTAHDHEGKLMSERDDQTALILKHNVKKGQEEHYREWLAKIPEILQTAPGFIGRDIFPPSLPDQPYTVVLRFDSGSALQAWIETPEHKEFRRESQYMLHQIGRSTVASGFDLWL